LHHEQASTLLSTSILALLAACTALLSVVVNWNKNRPVLVLVASPGWRLKTPSSKLARTTLARRSYWFEYEVLILTLQYLQSPLLDYIISLVEEKLRSDYLSKNSEFVM
jgi:hypothetical protein